MITWLRGIWERWIAGRREQVMFERAWIVDTTDSRVTCTTPRGAVERVTWSELLAVEVHTNDSGPGGADVWWVLFDRSGSCAVPQGATGEAALLERLMALPGFDHEQFMGAMCCTDNAVFRCWSGEAADDDSSGALKVGATGAPLPVSEVLRIYAEGRRDFRALEIGPDDRGTFDGAVLDLADFSAAFVDGSFVGASLRGARFVDANVKGCTFDQADLTGASFAGAAIDGASFDGAVLAGPNAL
jgi:hypothetical protein